MTRGVWPTDVVWQRVRDEPPEMMETTPNRRALLIVNPLAQGWEFLLQRGQRAPVLIRGWPAVIGDLGSVAS